MSTRRSGWAADVGATYADTAAPRWANRSRTWGQWAWFAAMAGGWIAFLATLVLSNATVGELWRWVRDLPLLVEWLPWLAFFPFVLAAGFWESSWDEWLRLALVATCAGAWTLIFFPWRGAR